MSIQTFLHLEALGHIKQDLVAYKNKLEQLLVLDVEKAKAELTSVVAHFEAELARVRAAIEPKVLAHIDEGASPQQAVAAAANNVPTKRDLAAKV
jgi:hypothetical protein